MIREFELRPSSKPPVPTLRTSSAILFLNFVIFRHFRQKNDYVQEVIFTRKFFEIEIFVLKHVSNHFESILEKNISKFFTFLAFFGHFWTFLIIFGHFFKKIQNYFLRLKCFLNYLESIPTHKKFFKTFLRFFPFLVIFWQFLGIFEILKIEK